MQDLNWNDLRYFLALFRTGHLSSAGRALSVNETTVSRRLQKLEKALGARLFIRSSSGRLDPTDLALAMVGHAELMEAEHRKIENLSGGVTGQIKGRVRISSVPVLVNRVLVRHLSGLFRKHPALEVELVPSAENVDLTKREADIALRFARPAHGGLSTKATKLKDLRFSVFAPAKTATENTKLLAWIGYDELHASLPQARWLRDIMKKDPRSEASLRIADIETAIEAVANGLGKSILPDCVALSDQRLRRVAFKAENKLPSREVWMLSHKDQSQRSTVVAVKDWLSEIPWEAKFTGESLQDQSLPG